MTVQRTSQGLEVIPSDRVKFCRYCSEATHYGMCREMKLEREAAQAEGRGRPVPNVRSGPGWRPVGKVIIDLESHVSERKIAKAEALSHLYGGTVSGRFSATFPNMENFPSMVRSLEEVELRRKLDKHLDNWWATYLNTLSDSRDEESHDTNP